MLTVGLWGIDLGSLRFCHPLLGLGLFEGGHLCFLHLALKALHSDVQLRILIHPGCLEALSF